MACSFFFYDLSMTCSQSMYGLFRTFTQLICINYLFMIIHDMFISRILHDLLMRQGQHWYLLERNLAGSCNLEVFSTCSNPRRVSLHFSLSRGIQLDLSRPYTLHENFSPSCGIYRLYLLIDLFFAVYFE